MAILPILKYPEPLLKEKSQPVEQFDQELADLAADMGETMLAAPGAGLAAPQIGCLKRLIVIAGAENDEHFDERVIVLVNPRITWSGGEQVYEEGCLSVLELTEKVIRAAEVEVEAQDLEGRPIHLKADGRRAVILQHEIDHLDGILFIDHLSQLKRDIYKRRLKKLMRENDDD